MLDKRRRCMVRHVRMIFLVFFIIILFLSFSQTVSASWTQNVDDSIYTEGKTMEIEEEKAKKAGSFEKKISGLFCNLATGLNDMLLKEGCDLDRIILGRVHSGGMKVSLFTFELRTGNGYGVVAATVYKILRSVIFIVIAGIMLTKLVKGQFSSGSARAREKMKDAFSSTVISFSLLILMPFLYDMFLYFRDVLLYSVAAEGTGGIGIIESFRVMADGSKLFADSMIYFSAVCSAIWFAFEYIGIAMANVVMFICFPFVTIFMFYDKNKLMNWCWNVLSLGITPIIDISMLMIPIFIGYLTYGLHPFIQLLVTWSVIPSRKLFKNALGLNSTGEAVLSGLSAIAMMHGVISLMRGGAGIAQNVGGKLKGSMEDRKKQHYHEDMARAQQGEDFGFVDAGRDDYVREKNINKTSSNHLFGLFKNLDTKPGQKTGTQAETGESILNETQMSESGITSDEDSIARKEMQAENAGIFSSRKAAGDGILFGIGGEKKAKGNTTISELEIGEEKERLEHENNEHQENIAMLQQHISGLERENAKMESEDLANNSHDNKERIAGNRLKIAESREAIAKEKSKIAKNKSQIDKIKSILGSNLRPHISEQELQVMRKYATVDNFEQPEFADLDHGAKSELYGRRAKKRLLQGIGVGVGGTAGWLGGSLLGLSATGFYGRSTAAMVTGAMANGGSIIGGNIGSMAGAGVYRTVAAKGIRKKVKNQTYTEQHNMPEPDVTSAIKKGMTDLNDVTITQEHAVNVRNVIASGAPRSTSGNNIAKKVTIKQQVQEIVSNPATHSVIQEFCQEMAKPGSGVMRHYEHMARNKILHANEGIKYTDPSFHTKVNEEIASQMSGDMMRRISKEGVSVASSKAYHMVRKNIESNICNILKQWEDMSGFSEQ